MEGRLLVGAEAGEFVSVEPEGTLDGRAGGFDRHSVAPWERIGWDPPPGGVRGSGHRSSELAAERVKLGV
ncbi:hypothetical protein GCM10025780_10560 [Frondihabitans cladoniiphilus]|uniref:Uncharacterized protein n=1 Tax=Frondihabitans cladoniiphilus TaxID=715785 RepID=A0ABP8VPZ8_9MICO